jgi:hypothetical protein
MLVSSPDEEALEDGFAAGEAFLNQRRRNGAEAGSQFAAHKMDDMPGQQTGAITLCLSSIDFQRLGEAAKPSIVCSLRSLLLYSLAA